MQNTNMQFHIIFSKRSIVGEFELHDDSSLTYAVDNGGFSILLGGKWALCLIADYQTGKVEGFETIVDDLSIIISDLSIPKRVEGALMFSSDEELNRGSGCHYIPFENKIYYDEKMKIMCIGDKNAKGQAVEFAKNIIAVVDDVKLVSIYLDLNEIDIEHIV